MTEDKFLSDLLNERLKSMGFESLAPPLLKYLLLLNKWNSAYNLTAIRDMALMIDKHLLDSLAILPWIKGARILDVGTGAGLPGIPLSIARPELQFVLLDSNGKKIRFLKEVKRQLDLKNLEVVQSRVEHYHPADNFDTVLSRAFSSLEQMIHWTQHLIAPHGIWLAMKGHCPESELNELHKPYRVESYHVEGIDGARCCVVINQQS